MNLSVFALLLAGAQPTLEPSEPRLGDLVRVYWSSNTPGRGRGFISAFGCESDLMPLGASEARAGWVGYIGTPADTSTGAHAVSVSVPGSPEWRGTIRVRSREVAVSQLSVDRKFTAQKRSAELQARLDREAESIAAVWTSTPTPGRWLRAASRPTPGGPSSRYGNQRRFNGELRSVHYGLDLRGRSGSPVRAPFPGEVVLSADRWSAGGTIYLDHGAGLLTGYFHLSRRDRTEGDAVRVGQRLGAVGATGRVTGPHLHWALAVRCRPEDGSPARGMYVDPEPLLDGFRAAGDR